MATTQRRSWSRPLLIGVLVLLVAGIAAALVFQHLLEQKIQQQFSQNARFEGTAEAVEYSLLSNRLTISGITLKKYEGLPMDASCAKFTSEGIDRLYLLDILLDKTLKNVPPVLHVGDVEVQDLRVNLDKELTISLGQRRIVNLSLDMNQLKPLLLKHRAKGSNAASTDTSSLVYQDILTCLSYDKGYGRDIQFALHMPEALVLTIKELMESQVDHGNFAYSEVSGIRLTGDLGSLMGKAGSSSAQQELGSIGRIAIEDFYCTSELLSAAPDSMTEDEALDLLKKIFLGEKPFVKKFVIENLRSEVTPNARVALQNLTWENTSTSPFNCSLSVKGLSTPTMPSLGLLGYKRLDVDASVALEIPTRVAGPAFCKLFLDGKNAGILTLHGDYIVQDLKAFHEADPRFISVSKFVLALKDEGLLKRVEQLSALFTGKPSLSAALDASMSTMPERYRTPTNLKNLEAVKTFLDHSGSIEFVFAPEKPLPITQLEDDTVFFNTLTVTATPAQPATAAPDTTK